MEAMMANALSDNERKSMDAYWRAANYLSVGQTYLYDNPLLKQNVAEIDRLLSGRRDGYDPRRRALFDKGQQ
jgi:phosphoketolase